MFVRLSSFLLATAAACPGQNPADALSPRILYYNEGSRNDSLPPIPKTKPPAAVPPKSPAPVELPPKTKKAAPAAAPAAENGAGVKQEAAAPAAVNPTAVSHLGIRYNVVLVDPRGVAADQPVDSDRSFRTGECIALRIESNNSGYLYVVERGSSGRWTPLLPSSLMPDENNFIKARNAIRIPANYCLDMDATRGEEHLFVVLSRNPEDLYDLHSAIRASNGQPNAPSRNQPAPVLVSSNQIGAEVKRMQESLQARDLGITKITKPSDAQEPAGAVYAVNVSNKATDRVVIEIKLRHE